MSDQKDQPYSEHGVTVYDTGREYVIDETLTRRERAIRAAAIIDTDGSIHIGEQYSLRCNVSNQSLRLLNWLCNNYGGTVKDKPYLKQYKKPVYSWSVTSALAEQFLREISEYLLIKHEQAMLALEFRKYQGRHMIKVPKEEKREIWEEFRIQMKKLNNMEVED